jgi:hypothetical protein
MRNRILLMVVVMAGSWVLAEPTTAPHRPPRWGGEGPMMRRPPAATQPMETEWREVADFFQKNSPQRWALFQKVQRPEIRAHFRHQFAQRYGEIRRLAGGPEKELYENKVRQVQLEDQILSLAWRRGPATAPADLEPELRSKVGELLRLRLEERAARVQRIKQLVDVEERKLKTDQERAAQTVDTFVQDSLRGNLRWLMRPEPPPDGPGRLGQPGRRATSRPMEPVEEP